METQKLTKILLLEIHSKEFNSTEQTRIITPDW